MYSSTYTSSHTITDVDNVLDCFEADYRMIGQSTGLVSSSDGADVIHDIRILTKEGYLKGIDIVLLDDWRKEIRANKYSISEDASDWTAERPGDCLWPKMPHASVDVILTFSSQWSALSREEKENLKKDLNLWVRWERSDIDTRYPHLSEHSRRYYKSNSYGMERVSYQ